MRGCGTASLFEFMHFLLGYKRLNRMQRRTKREAVSIVEVGNLEIKFSNSLIIHKEKITTMTLSGLDIVY